MGSVFEPFLLSLIAGMATGLGGMIVLMLRRVGDRVVSFSMGFASSVMLMVAFNNLFLEAEKLLAHIELTVVFSQRESHDHNDNPSKEKQQPKNMQDLTQVARHA